MNPFPVKDWSYAIRNEANGSNALGKNRTHDEYSPGFTGSGVVGAGVISRGEPAGLDGVDACVSNRA